MIKEPQHRLRWKLSKIWNVPIDHEYFQNTNLAQWYWYYYNIVEDNEEEFKLKRDLVEYHASFIEPDMVQRARKQRNHAENDTKKDTQFSNTLKNLFGRDIELDGKVQSNSDLQSVHEVSNVLDRVDEYTRSQKKIKSKSKYNFIDWINFNLES